MPLIIHSLSRLRDVEALLSRRHSELQHELATRSKRQQEDAEGALKVPWYLIQGLREAYHKEKDSE